MAQGCGSGEVADDGVRSQAARLGDGLPLAWRRLRQSDRGCPSGDEGGAPLLGAYACGHLSKSGTIRRPNLSYRSAGVSVIQAVGKGIAA
jgi:hypothetical protein